MSIVGTKAYLSDIFGDGEVVKIAGTCDLSVSKFNGVISYRFRIQR
jgi:hypothetical protein